MAGNTTEDDLCCQCNDHWRQFLEFGKDKSVNCSADGTNAKRCNHNYDKWCICVGLGQRNVNAQVILLIIGVLLIAAVALPNIIGNVKKAVSMKKN